MPDMDLATALNMFKSGVQDLAFSRALGQANDSVQQIKTSDMNEQEQRAQLQQLSNGLVTKMAAIGVPATTMQAVAGAVGPKQYANANAMNSDALLTGNKGLAETADQQQAFEQNPEYKVELMKSKLANQNPLALMKFQNEKNEFATKQLTAYGKNLDSSAASSRSAFGTWASTNARGDRLGAILGNPAQWNNMTAQQLQLVTEGLTQMSKGGVATKEEQQVLAPHLLKLTAANQMANLTGKPVGVDLSGFAGLYNSMIQREDTAAKEKMVDIVMNKVNSSAKLADLDPQQFKLTTANSLKQFGINVNPDTIQVDKAHGVKIPEIQSVIDQADQVPKAVKDLYTDLNSSDTTTRLKAQSVLNQNGLTPNTSRAEAIKLLRSKVKSQLFE